MAETPDNYSRSMSIDNDSALGQSNENLSMSHSPPSESTSEKGSFPTVNGATSTTKAESRKRISIAEYKQRKKSTGEPLNVSIGDDNNINRNLNECRFEILSSQTNLTSIKDNTVSSKNGQLTYGSIEEYYAHVYYFQNYYKEPTLDKHNGYDRHVSSNVPHISHDSQNSIVSYSHGNVIIKPALSNINSTESRLHRVEGWNTNSIAKPNYHNSTKEPELTDESLLHAGESPINHRSNFSIDQTVMNTPKLTAASALNDPNECTSYKEWRKRKYGIDYDPHGDSPSNNINDRKIRKVGPWKNKGPRDNERRQYKNRNENNEESWDMPGPTPSTQTDITAESWDDDVPVPKSTATSAETWNDDSAPSQPTTGPQTNLESWDEDPIPPQPKNSYQINLESWDDNAVPPQPTNTFKANLECWDEDAVPPQPMKSFQANLESWNEDATPPQPNKSFQINLESWDDDAVPPQPIKDFQANLESWGEDTTPPQPNKSFQINLESWDDDTGNPQPNNDSQKITEPWRNNSAAPPPPPRAPQGNLESWDDDTELPPLKSLKAHSTQLVRNSRVNSWENTQGNYSTQEEWKNRKPAERKSKTGSNFGNDYGGNHSSRDGRQSRQLRANYRSNSRSSDNSDSGYSKQNYRGNNRRHRSGSRDSGRSNWSNRSKDNSESYQSKPWNNRDHRSQDRQNNRGRNNRGRSWNYQEPISTLPPVLMDAESWDDDVLPPQSTKDSQIINIESWANPASSSDNPKYCENIQNLPPVPIINDPTLESWDDDITPPQSKHPTEGGIHSHLHRTADGECTPSISIITDEQQGNNNDQRGGTSARALCTTCSFQLSHRCKYMTASNSWTDLKPGELYKCQCSLVFLHAINCAAKIDQTYAPMNSETGLFKQVGRSHIYVCKHCDFKFIIDNLKESIHFFSQLTTKKGDKIREKVIINDPKGIEAFMHLIEQQGNEISYLIENPNTRDQRLKQRISNICHCNQGCCTIYHDCPAYAEANVDHEKN